MPDLYLPFVPEVNAYKHHYAQKEVKNTDVRIVLGYVYVVNASEGDLGKGLSVYKHNGLKKTELLIFTGR